MTNTITAENFAHDDTVDKPEHPAPHGNCSRRSSSTGTSIVTKGVRQGLTKVAEGLGRVPFFGRGTGGLLMHSMLKFEA